MKKKLFAGLIMVLFVSTAVFAQKGPRGEQNFDRRDGQGLIERLDLTEDQQTKIEVLRVTHLKSTQELRDQLRENQVKLDNLLNDESINQKAVEKLVKDMGELRTNLMLAQVNHRMEVRHLLNDEQRVKFDMMAKHRHHHQRMGRF